MIAETCYIILWTVKLVKLFSRVYNDIGIDKSPDSHNSFEASECD